MKIFFFTFEFPPYFGGGLSTYMREVCNAYAGKPDQITVFCVDNETPGHIVEEQIHDNIQLVRFRAHVQHYYADFGYWTAVANEFSQHAAFYAEKYGKPDVIETADGFGIGYIAIQKRICLDPFFKDIPIVTTAHTPTYMIDRLNEQSIYRLPNYWHQLMEKFCIAAPDFLVSPSQALLDRLKDEIAGELPPHKVIYNPYQSQFSSPKALESVGTHPERDHFFVASRLTYWKGAEHIVNIFHYLWEKNLTDAKLVIYGDDTPYEAVGLSMSEFLTKKFGRYIEAGLLELAGKQPREKINKRAQSAYAQIHPSLFDNFPYSVLESMDAGNVTIVHNQGGHNELIQHGKNALVIDVRNPESASDIILKAIALSESERLEIAKAAHDTVRKKCSYEVFYEQKTALFSSLIKAQAETRIFPFTKEIPNTISDERDIGEHGLLSIVIPYFNMAEFIDETLNSVMNSDYNAIEVILIDDGSTDPASIEKLKEIEKRQDKFPIKIIRTENQGVAKARNTGVQHAGGQFLALLDADDLVLPEYYLRAINILERYDNVGFVGCWNEDFSDESGETIRIWPTFNTEPPMQLIFNSTNCQGLVYWRGAFERAGQHDPELRMFLDDWESTIGLMAAGYHGVMIPNALFRYRIRNSSIFRSKQGLWALNYEKIALKHQDYYNKWGAEITCFMNANGPNTCYHIPGFPSSLQITSSETWLTRAHEGGYIKIVKFFAGFMERSFVGRVVRRNNWIQRIFEFVMNRI